MTDSVEEFVREAPGVRSAEIVRTGQYLHVYHGELDEPSGETVAIYTLAPDVTDDAVHDAFERAASQWQNPSTHPNIVRVFTRSDRPRPWLAAEKPGGDPLDAAQPGLTLAEVRDVITDTAEALRNAALYNTTHLALAPTCVRVVPDADGVGGVVDEWGLERACRVAAEERPVTPFTAPELLETPDGGTERTDVYGLGAVAYYALTSQPPVAGSGDLEKTISAGKITPPSASAESLPTAVDDIVLEALATDPADRPDSAYAFGQTFDRALSPAIEPTPAATGADDGTGEPTGAAASGTAGVTNEPETEAETQTESGGVVTRRRALAALGIGTVGLGGAWAATNPEGFDLQNVLGEESESDTSDTNRVSNDSTDDGPADDDSGGNAGDGDGGGNGGGTGNSDSDRTDESADGGRTSTPSNRTIRLGVLMGVSGPLERLGPPIRDAATLVSKQVNDADTPFSVETQFEDTETDPAQGISGAESLVNAGFPMICGALSSEVTIQVANNVTIPGGVTQCSPASTSPRITGLEDNDLLFRTPPTDALQGVLLARIASERLGVSSASTLFFNNAYGQGLAGGFADAFENEFGGTITAEVSFAEGKSSYTSNLQTALADDPETMLIVGYPASGVQIFRDFYSNFDRADMPILVPDGLQSQDLPGNVGRDMSNVVGTAPAGEGPGLDFFEEQYTSTYDVNSKSPFTKQAYDAAAVLVLANAAAGENDGAAVRDEMRAVTNEGDETITAGNLIEGIEMAASGTEINYQGVADVIEFDDNGDQATATYDLFEYDSDGYEVVESVSV